MVFVFVFVFVFVVVVAPGDVAALGSGNAAVGVIKPVNEHAPWDLLERIVAMLTKLLDP